MITWKDECRAIDQQIKKLKNNKKGIINHQLNNSPYKKGDIIEFLKNRDKWVPGWIKEINIDFNYDFIFKIGEFKKDGSPHKTKILAYYANLNRIRIKA